MDIGKRLKTLREARGLTLEQVGTYIGVNKATVQRYEIGNIDIKRNTAIRLAECLHTSPSYIMGWTDDPKYTLTQALPQDPPPLSPRLAHLSQTLEQLNEEGQEKLVDYADDLVSSGRYIKTGPSVLDKKA